MTKYCVVAPANMLKEMKDRSVLGRQHLLLAHDVVKHSKEYQEVLPTSWWSDLPNSIAPWKIIMDNSAFELKKPVDSKMVWDAVSIVNPTTVVLPDYWLDGPQTYKAAKIYLDEWASSAAAYKCGLMCIPQGKDYQEWCACAERLAKLPNISWWGIPRNFKDKIGLSRRVAISICKALNPQRQIHLFGFSNIYFDDLVACADPSVASIDSTTPVRAGSLNIDFQLSSTDLPPRGEWWTQAKWNDRIIPNLDYARRIF